MSKDDDQVMPTSYQEWVINYVENELKPIRSTQRTLLRVQEWLLSSVKALKPKTCDREWTSEFLPLDTD